MTHEHDSRTTDQSDIAPHPGSEALTPKQTNGQVAIFLAARVLSGLLLFAVIALAVILASDPWFDSPRSAAYLCIVVLTALSVVSLAWWRDGLGGLALLAVAIVLTPLIGPFAILLIPIGGLHLLAWTNRKTSAKSAAGMRDTARWIFTGSSVALLLVGALAAVLLMWNNATTQDMNGEVVLVGSASGLIAGDLCNEHWVYFDIATGSPVEIRDDQGKLLSRSHLGSGTASESGDCVFPFTLSNVADADAYTITIGYVWQRTYSFSKDELERTDWHVQIVVGNG